MTGIRRREARPGGKPEIRAGPPRSAQRLRDLVGADPWSRRLRAGTSAASLVPSWNLRTKSSWRPMPGETERPVSTSAGPADTRLQALEEKVTQLVERVDQLEHRLSGLPPLP